MTFLHTADWQIGMKCAAAGPQAGRVREERLAAARRAIQFARKRSAAFLVLAGDTFEDNAVDRVLVRQTADILRSLDGPVYLIPGNHDPLVPGSVWEHPVWTESANLHVCTEAQPIERDDCILYPCPLRSKYSNKDPTSWIQHPPGGKTGVGIAHGTVEGIPAQEPDHPIPRNAAELRGLDYLAIGHWHSYAHYPDGNGVVRMAYPGTLETTKFGERDSGNVLLVEIASPGSAPVLTPLRTGGLNWITLDKALALPGDTSVLLREVNGLSNPDHTLLRVRLDGVFPAEDRQTLIQLQEILTTRFLHGALESEAIPSPEGDSWIAALPEGPCRQAAAVLRDRAAQSSDPAQRSACTQALMILLELHEKAAS